MFNDDTKKSATKMTLVWPERTDMGGPRLVE